MQVPQNRLACHSHLSSRLSQDLYRNPQWLPSTMPPQHVSRRREYLELPLCQSYPSRHALTEQVSQSWRFYVIVSMASLNALSDTFVGETMKSNKPGWRIKYGDHEWVVYVMFVGMLWYGVLTQDFLAKDEALTTLIATLFIGYTWGYSTKGKR